MVELTDMTLRQTNGNFKEVCHLMREDGAVGEWMLRSEAFVTAPMISSNFTLHLWNSGRVVIFEAMRPLAMETPIDDLQELLNWVRNNGWDSLWVDDRLIVERQASMYWSRMYLSGLVENDTLKQRDEEEHQRLTSAYLKEKNEEQEETNDAS